MTYMTTSTVKGRYAYRAWDGQWYIVDADSTGYPTRQAAVAAMNVMPRLAQRMCAHA